MKASAASARLCRLMLRKAFAISFLIIWTLSGICPLKVLVAKEYTDTIENFKVIKVRDGDTFVITIEDTPDVFGEKIVVRVIGIDTPELNDKREERKATAIKAKEELEKLLTSWKKIVLYNLALLLAVAVEINILDCWQV